MTNIIKIKPNECPGDCPDCGSEEISTQGMDGHYDLSVDWGCETCGYEWVEYYTFKGWEPKEY